MMLSRFLAKTTALAAASHLRACLFLVGLSLACFLPGFVTLQPMDRDEPRFAQATKQMLETRDFVDIRFQDEARHKKPVGIYWLQSLTVSAGEALGVDKARTQIWLYRLPSLIGAVAAVLLTYWALLAFTTPPLALLGAALMAASILLGVEARLAKTDALLAACAVATMGALARVWLDWQRALPFALHERNWLIFWSATALALLIKGPIVPMIWGLAVLVLALKERSFRWFMGLRPKTGLLICLVVVLPWFLAIAWKTGGAFFAESVGKDMLGKVAEGQEKHWGPPGLYLLIFFGTFWPAAALAAMALPFGWQHRKTPQVAFLAAWVLPSWLVFELVPTKLPHYVLPLYPALVALAMLALAAGALDPRRRGAVLTAALMALIPVLLLVGTGAGAWVLDRSMAFIAIPVLLIALVLAVLAVRMFARGDAQGALWLGVVASVVVSLGVYSFGVPVLRSLKLSPRLAEAVAAVPCVAPHVITAGYREPSLVFLVGTDLAMAADGAAAAQFMALPGCRVALVEARQQAAFDAELARSTTRMRLLTRVSGFNVNGGRKLDIAVMLRAE